MKYKFLLGCLALFQALISFGQSITNVIAVQKDNLVEITYNLECEYYADISIHYCEKAGNEFKGPLLHVYGDVGPNIEPGERKIIWDVLNEIEFLVGSEFIFRINALINFGKINDNRDGNVYKTVSIGNQIWMAENLASSSRNWITRTYDNEDINSSTHGYMYNWRGALKMCPEGWYLPSKDDFASLVS
jgi:hypothetical protein